MNRNSSIGWQSIRPSGHEFRAMGFLRRACRVISPSYLLAWRHMQRAGDWAMAVPYDEVCPHAAP
jgi:hypothetical protein